MDLRSECIEASVRILLQLALIAALAMVSCSSEKEGTGISGSYVGTQNFGIGQIASAMALTLRQQGAAITGTVTPPLQSAMVGLTNGSIQGNSVRFDVKYGNLTFHYEAMVQGEELKGSFQPLGCVMQSSGQPCVTDSDGTFAVRKQ